jgi:phosphoribosylformylglycinamidine cyclo-ligase
LSGFGHYAALIEIGSRIMALHSDGVGSKILIAHLMKKYDTIGIDCIAMNVNDIICVGAMPIGFLDYIALSSPDPNLVKEVFRGLSKAAKQCGMAIIGGETAIVPDLLHKIDSTSFDLVGTVFGIVNKKSLVLGEKIKEGDVILGVESSGLHSNGYSLARKVLLSKYKMNESAQFIKDSVGEELLRPTRIYVKPINELLNTARISVHGLAHITGGSFTKLSRLSKKVNYKLDNLPEPKGVFRLIMEDGHIQPREMYSTFNMGIGFCIILSKSSVNNAKVIFKRNKMKCTQIGLIEKGSGQVKAVLDGKLLALEP